MDRAGCPGRGPEATYTRPTPEQEKVIANCMMMDNRTELEAKLFSLGGKQVFIQSNPYMGELLRRGQVFTTAGRKKVAGPEYLVNRVAVFYYLEHYFFDHDADLALVTGYRLCEDGVWYSTSWLWDGERVLGHAEAVLYFGVKLTPEEAYYFISTTLAMYVPGDQGQGEPIQPAPP